MSLPAVSVPPLSTSLQSRLTTLRSNDGLTYASYYEMLREWVNASDGSWWSSLRLGLELTDLAPRWLSEVAVEELQSRLAEKWSTADYVAEALCWCLTNARRGMSPVSLIRMIGQIWVGSILHRMAIRDYSGVEPIADGRSITSGSPATPTTITVGPTPEINDDNVAVSPYVPSTTTEEPADVRPDTAAVPAPVAVTDPEQPAAVEPDPRPVEPVVRRNSPAPTAVAPATGRRDNRHRR